MFKHHTKIGAAIFFIIGIFMAFQKPVTNVDKNDKDVYIITVSTLSEWIIEGKCV